MDIVDSVAILSKAVEQRLSELGEKGQRWLDTLDDRIAQIEHTWGCSVGAPLGSASTAFVAEAIDSFGRDVIVKIAIPAGGTGYSSFEREVALLRHLAGPSYVTVLQHSAMHRALMLERLGPSLADLHRSVPEQIEVLAQTIAGAWRPKPPALHLVSGRQQAEYLAKFIGTEAQRTTPACDPRVVSIALKCLDRRIDSYTESTAVVIHGDAHPNNVLLARDGSFRLIDPEGLVSEPAHDLAIPLRGWVDELLAGEAVHLASSWCESLSTATGTDSTAIWDWAYAERVSTGLLLTRLGLDSGPRYLATAELLATGRPSR